MLLNRASTLYCPGIQAFESQLIEGRTIQSHLLVCGIFNAGFDGNQMAVHLLLGVKAQAEARTLTLSTNSILEPFDGHPVAIPSQDMIIGLLRLAPTLDLSVPVKKDEDGNLVTPYFSS